MHKSLPIMIFFLILITQTTAVDNKLSKISNNANNQNDPSDMPIGHYFTVQEFKYWDISSDRNAPFNRGTIKLRNKIENHGFIANSNARAHEGGVSPLVLFSPGEVPSQGSAEMHRVYAFNNWQYTDIVGYWGGGPGIAGYSIMLPTGSVIDAAHKNGAEVFGNIFLAPTAYGGKIQWVNEFLEKDGPNFPIADKMIEAAEYFGFDGWFINQETAGGSSSTANDMIEFMKYIKSKSSLKIYWYDAMTESGTVNWQNELNGNNDQFFQDGDEKVSDYMFLNFWWYNSSNLADSKAYAKSLGRNEYSVYAGIDCAIKGYETYVDWERLFPDGQEHNTSVGLYRPDDFLWYQPNTIEEKLKREKRFWSGANGDPSNTETTHAWKGFANYIPANSVIDDIPFTTNFSLGLGNNFFIDGKIASHQSQSENGWNNIALQDILPSWRWVIESNGSKLKAGFDFNDAYYGGNSLKFSGNITSENNIKLYKTKLLLTNDSKIEVALKSSTPSSQNIKVGFAFEEDPYSFSFISIEQLPDTNWTLNQNSLSQFSGKTIAVISLMISSADASDIDINLGRISIYNGEKKSPAPISNLQIINKVNESDFVTLRLSWDHSTDYVSHYNVYKKNKNGERYYIGGTPNNSCFIPWIGKEESDTNIVIEVEAVGLDNSVSIPITKSFVWYSQPEKASNPSPADTNTEVYRNVKLTWTPGRSADVHTVYFGKSENLQVVETIKNNEFDPGLLEPNTTYYWKINERNLLYTTEGDIWSFTTGSSILDTANNALIFDGKDDFVNCGNDPSLQITGNEITLEAWINASHFKSETFQGVILAKDQGGANSDYGYMLRCGKDGRINFNVGNGRWNELESQGNEIKLNTWHHVAGVLDGKYMRIYIDGNEVNKKPLYSTSVQNAANANLLIGDSPAFSGRVFIGKIDEVRIWNVGRSGEQIKRTMNTQLSEEYYTTPDSGLVGYWTFNEGSGQILSDLTTFENDGMLGASNGADEKDPSWVKSSSVVSVEKLDVDENLPAEFVLNQNYPNPFNPYTTISFTAPEEDKYKLEVFNLLGEKIDILVDGNLTSGIYSVKFNGSSLSSGIYFYRLSNSKSILTKKMILIK